MAKARSSVSAWARGGFAQIEKIGQPLDGAADDAVRVGRLDFADDPDGQFLHRPVGGEGVHEVAETILAPAQTAVGGGLDAPGAQMLAVVVPRRQAHDLDQLPDRPVVGVDGVVKNADLHGI